jgi:hypothetical protein
LHLLALANARLFLWQQLAGVELVAVWGRKGEYSV